MRDLVKFLTLGLGALLLWAAGAARAEEIKTLTGAVYKDATITRAEPDGLVIAHANGIVKIPFAELSDDLQRAHRYDPVAAKRHTSQIATNQKILYETGQAQKRAATEQRNKLLTEAANERYSKKLRALIAQQAVLTTIKPFSFGEDRTIAHVQLYGSRETGKVLRRGLDRVPEIEPVAVGRVFVGAIAEPMAQGIEAGDVTVVALYKIGHTSDSSRHPLFTTKIETVVRWLNGEKVL